MKSGDFVAQPWQTNPLPSAHCHFISLQTPSLTQFSSALFLTTTHVALKGWRRTLPGSKELTPKSLRWPFLAPASSHSPSFSPQPLQSGLFNDVIPCYSSFQSLPVAFISPENLPNLCPGPVGSLASTPAYVFYHSAPRHPSRLASCS